MANRRFLWKIWVNGRFYRAGTGSEEYLEHIEDIRSSHNYECTVKTEIK